MRILNNFISRLKPVTEGRVRNKQTGFTIVEILVVITVAGLLASPVIFSLGSFYDDNLTSVNLSIQDTSVKNATALISNDLKEATGFRASLTIPTASPQPPLGSSSDATAGGNWSYCGTTTTSTTCDGVTTNNNYSSKRVLIAYVDATDGPTTSTTYSPVFLNTAAFNLSTAKRATNAYIYFVAPDRENSSINNLYRRTIVNVDPTNNTDWSNALYDCSVPIGQNPSSTNCITPNPSLDTKNTCASTVVSTNTSFCGSRDAIILKNVESFWVDYYYSNNQKISNVYTNNATTAATVVSNIKDSAQSVQVTITKKLAGSPAKRSSASARIINNSTVTTPITATEVNGLPSYGTSFAMSPDGSKAYIVTQGSDVVTVINTSTNAQIAQISVDANSASYAAPDPIVITPDGSKVYVGNVQAGTVSVINTSTNALAATVTVGSGPYNLAITPDGSKVYVANSNANTVSVINTSTNTVAATIAAGTSPYQLAVTPDGSKVYVGNAGAANTVTVINTSTNTVAATIATGSCAARLKITPDGSKVYVGCANAVAINTSTNTVAATITLGTGTNVQNLAVTPDSTKVYIVNYGTNSVNVINTSTNSLAATIAVGTNPIAIAMVSNGGKVYVGNDITSNVSVIDTSTNTNVATLAVGANPRALASTNDSSKIYVGSSPMYVISNT